MTKIRFESHQHIVQNSNYIASDMNGEKVMLDIESGKYYNLGAIGGRIWDLSSTPVTLDAIVDVLTSEYEVSPETCKQQVEVFIQQMLNEGLIEVQHVQDPTIR